MSRNQTILKGTLILTLTGITTRFMGFFFRIFMSHVLGEKGMGIYQLIFPVYALCYSFTSAGIELALSRCVSKYYALNNKKKAREILYTSFIISLTLACAATLFLQNYSNIIAKYFLHNTDTYELLLVLSYAFPFTAIHSCIVGYYLGLKQTKIPAFSQLIEQTFRIFSIYFIYRLSFHFNYDFRVVFAVLGIVIGEIFSSMYCIKKLSGKGFHHSIPRISVSDFISSARELVFLSLPITSSRILLNILQSIEATNLPLALVTYGYSYDKSLSIYGVLTGMALPCILFPSAITNAVSTMLLPTVAELQALNDSQYLLKIIKKTIFTCTILGILCCIFFLLSGNIAGEMLFKSNLAGQFIFILAWMCPFLYTNNTLISIINGIGKTQLTLFINILSLSIRLISIFNIVPFEGVYGYLISLLLSQFVTFFLCILILYKQFKAEVL